ncbi:sodium/hydrogen exchanger [Calocera viscosa TUFC12733]|uniref:Sodium/hydrogen exchanger n=1 Tax=Calocera viscosa (strain TUFC12733) TaxID=1330018 RepID=A0A167IAV5_CALVF|nr:sodium/hydrogen exchanger [Calocera viscosa TUFC12733]
MALTYMADPVIDAPAPEEEELYSSWALFILCILLIGALFMSYYLQIKRIRAVHETVVSIFAGMVVGLIIRLSPGHLIREMLTFKHTLFFNLLLPPIILNSGYELKQENFFRNFGSILTFAFLGTFISAVGIGLLTYVWSMLGLEGLKLTLLECLTFGTTLSATDAVTILAIFNSYKVDPKLYSVIFGESILNDAVSIVIYDTLTQFHGEEVRISSLFHGTGIFLLSFSISMFLGVSAGLGCSLMLKHSSLHRYPGIESCLVALVAYTSYFLSNGLSMSGIVSLLFCGITLKHYAYHTMSKRTQRTTKYMFQVLAQLSENFIFIYLGLNLFTQDIQVFKPLFIVVSAIAVLATRYLAVFPLATIINFVYRARGQRQDELPHSYQMMLYWAGLRGAVGVALAAGIRGDNANALRTTVLMVVVLTVILLGGTTARMLEVLGIRMGVEDDDDSDEEEPFLGPAGFGDTRTRYPGMNTAAARAAGIYGVSLADESTFSLNDYDSRNRPTVQRGLSLASEDEYSDSEVLPYQDGTHTGAASPRDAQGIGLESLADLRGALHIPRDSRWFTEIDERYLLPLFSNSVASRRFHARKASARRLRQGTEGTPEADESDGELPVRPAAAALVLGPDGRPQNFAGSVSDFFSALGSPRMPSSPRETEGPLRSAGGRGGAPGHERTSSRHS